MMADKVEMPKVVYKGIEGKTSEIMDLVIGFLEEYAQHKEDAWSFVSPLVYICCSKAAQAQRELLWKEGWRRVPSVDEIYKTACEIEGVESIGGIKHGFRFYRRLSKFCMELHHWLMEGE